MINQIGYLLKVEPYKSPDQAEPAADLAKAETQARQGSSESSAAPESTPESLSAPETLTTDPEA
jgi:hypothetical protein